MAKAADDISASSVPRACFHSKKQKCNGILNCLEENFKLRVCSLFCLALTKIQGGWCEITFSTGAETRHTLGCFPSQVRRSRSLSAVLAENGCVGVSPCGESAQGSLLLKEEKIDTLSKSLGTGLTTSKYPLLPSLSCALI